MENNYILNPNPLGQFLQKEQKDFTKADIIRYVTENEIEMINFRYVGGDGRLKTLNFIISSLEHLDSILTYGEEWTVRVFFRILKPARVIYTLFHVIAQPF